MEISPGVHAVQLLGATGHAFFEPRLTLIDAGLRGSGRLLARYLAAHGRSVEEIDRIVCTHGHPDHAGGVPEIVAAAGDVDVLMHPADSAGLQVGVRDFLRRPTRGRFFASMTPMPESTTVAAPVSDVRATSLVGRLSVPVK